jgi:hypothetical protein
MATLQQTLRGLPQADEQLVRGPGGVLQRGPTLKEATKKAGLAAAPTTPMGAEFLGVDKQVSKMAGTPQQVQATLQTALRQKQYGRETTEQEAGAMTKSADMQKLGGLGDRVTKMITGELAKVATSDVALSPDVEIIRQDPTGKTQASMDAMLRIVQSGQDLDQITKAVPEAAEALGNIAKGLIRDPKNVKVAEFLPELGYTAEDLAALLNVSAGDIQGYSVEDLQNKINQVSSEEFTRTQQLQQQATSPSVGAAERGLAREAARELSAVGVRASEADMQRLTDELSTADQVSLFGEVRSITDWLADENISALIKDVLESPKGSQLRKDMEAQAPDLYGFITRNETILKEAATNIETAGTAFKGIQTTNKNLYALLGMSDEAAKIFVPQLTGLQSKEYTRAEIPVLAYIDTLTDAEKKLAVNELNQLQATNPTLAAQIAGLTPEKLAALGIGKPGSNYEKMVKYNQDVDTISNLSDTDGNAIIANVFNDVGSVRAANELIDNNNVLVALGYPSGVSMSAPINPASVKTDILAARPKVSVADAADGKVPVGGKISLGEPNYPKDTKEELLYTTLRPVLKDGSLSAQEINDPEGVVSTLNFNQLLTLRDIANRPGAKIDKPALDARLNELRSENTAREFLAVGGQERKNTDPALDIDRWARLLDPKVDGNKVDKAAVRDLISRTALGEFQSGRYRLKYAEGTLERLKQLGLLAPEHIKAFNDLAAYRLNAYQATGLPGGVRYPYGVDQQGNALQKPKNLVKLIDRKKNRIIDVSPQDISYYQKQGYEIYKGR